MSSNTSTLKPRALSRPTAWLASLALVAGGLAAVAGTSTSASAVEATDYLVVTDAAAPFEAPGEAVSVSAKLATFNLNGSATTKNDIALPTVADGANKPFSLGDSDSNGSLSRTADKQFLTVAGFAAAPNPSLVTLENLAVKKTTATNVPRLVARIDSLGNVDTTTTLPTNAFNREYPRSVVSADGSAFYVSGNGGAKPTDVKPIADPLNDDAPYAGVVKVDLGGSNPVKIAAIVLPQKNVRLLQIADGDLWATSDKAPLTGIGNYGTELPTSAVNPTQKISIPQPVAPDAEIPTSFVVLDTDGNPGVDTIYVVIETKRIEKFTSPDGATWTSRGSKAGRFQALTAKVDGSNVDLFAIEGDVAGNALVHIEDGTTSLSDAATFGSATNLQTAPAGRVYRGVAFAPDNWILDTPGNVAASQAEEATTVTWDAVEGATSYDVSVKQGANPATTVNVLSTDPLSKEFTGLEGDVLYDVSVVAKNSSGSSAAGTTSVTPTARPVPATTATIASGNAGYGNKLPVTVTVDGTGVENAPTGTVEVTVGTKTTKYSGALVDQNDGTSKVIITLPGGFATPGTTVLHAKYLGTAGGDPEVDFQASPLVNKNVSIWRASTSTKFAFGPWPSSTKTSLATVTVKYSSSGLDPAFVAKPEGMLRFYDGTKLIASKKMYKGHNGVVAITIPKVAKGAHNFKVTYGGSSLTPALDKSSTSAVRAYTVK